MSDALSYSSPVLHDPRLATPDNLTALAQRLYPGRPPGLALYALACRAGCEWTYHRHTPAPAYEPWHRQLMQRAAWKLVVNDWHPGLGADHRFDWGRQEEIN